MKSVCVFCGSSPGARPEYAEAARVLGQAIARRGWRLVYGGGNVGLMGTVANAALEAGGQVIGVIPHALDRRELPEESRDALVAALADLDRVLGVVARPEEAPDEHVEALIAQRSAARATAAPARS